MNIKKVTNAIYIGDFFKRNDIKSNLGIKYNDSLSKSDLKDDAGRVYLLVVNEEIKKIGGSQSKAFKEMEDKCREDYKKIENKYPNWNYQESGRPWENNIQIAHSNFISESSGKSK